MPSDVLLIEPWITDFAAFDLWRKPLGLLCVGALLERVPLLPTAGYALNTALISEGIFMSSARGCEVSAETIKADSVSTAIDPFTPEKVWG